MMQFPVAVMRAVDCMTRRDLAVTQFPAAVTQISTAVMPAELATTQFPAAVTQTGVAAAHLPIVVTPARVANERGSELSANGSFAEAEAAYRAAAGAKPKWSVPWYNLGLM